MTRREFIKELCKAGFLAALVWALGSLYVRRSGNRVSDACTADGVCSQCRLAKNCGHPSAISYRERS